MNTVIRTAKVLKLLDENPRRFTDITRALQFTKSTAHRLLMALEEAEFIKKNILTSNYHLGPLMFQLAANPIKEHQFLIVSSAEEMRKLRDLSGETVALQISLGTERICLEEILSLEPIKFVSGKGAMHPIFVGSAGKMLLSMMNNDQIDILMKKFKYDTSAPNPIRNTEDLWKEIELARELNHSTSFGERVPGSASIAVPILDYFCPAIINVMGPADRLTKDKISSILDKMKSSAARISKEVCRLR